MAKANAKFEGYSESDSFVPNPTDVYGVVRTDGVTGGLNDTVEAVSPLFDHARRRDLLTAARALDPEDDSVPESLVVLPQGASIVHGDPEGAKARVLDKADVAADEIDDPLADPRTPSAREAGETYDPTDEEIGREEKNAVHRAATRAKAARKRSSKAGTTESV